MCTTGKRQSPIDIVTEDAIRIDLGPLKFNRYDFAFFGTLINNGHSGKQIHCNNYIVICYCFNQHFRLHISQILLIYGIKINTSLQLYSVQCNIFLIYSLRIQSISSISSNWNFFIVEIRLEGVPIHLSGSPLSSVYVFEQMHFHWSAEHTIDGLRDPLELHLVHYNKKYANFSVAAQNEDGIAVVAVLFEVIIRYSPWALSSWKVFQVYKGHDIN